MRLIIVLGVLFVLIVATVVILGGSGGGNTDNDEWLAKYYEKEIDDIVSEAKTSMKAMTDNASKPVALVEGKSPTVETWFSNGPKPTP